MINEIELSFYDENEQSYSITLSEFQSFVLSRVLGIEFKNNNILMFSDESLKKIIEMKSNPIDLIKI